MVKYRSRTATRSETAGDKGGWKVTSRRKHAVGSASGTGEIRELMRGHHFPGGPRCSPAPSVGGLIKVRYPAKCKFKSAHCAAFSNGIVW